MLPRLHIVGHISPVLIHCCYILVSIRLWACAEGCSRNMCQRWVIRLRRVHNHLFTVRPSYPIILHREYCVSSALYGLSDGTSVCDVRETSTPSSPYFGHIIPNLIQSFATLLYQFALGHMQIFPHFVSEMGDSNPLGSQSLVHRLAFLPHRLPL